MSSASRRHSQAPEQDAIIGSIETIRTMCPMNCHPTLCGMLVDVRDGELLAVRGDKDNPDSQGFLCVRGQASRQIIGNPKRGSLRKRSVAHARQGPLPAHLPHFGSIRRRSP
jgi:anaerobic selenocysteine-containing dehydrogenase